MLEEKKKKIAEQILQVAEYSQRLDTELTNTDPVMKILDKWEKAKSYFINQWGSLTVCSKEPISFSLAAHIQEEYIDNFVSSLESTFDSSEAAEFIDLHRNGFFKNELDENCTLPDGSVLPKGTKLLRCLKFFIDDPKVLEEAQNYGSRLIQENKIEGYLHLSVHPLDYLSSSENTYSWRSCHALDGEYRGGNLSYMLDESTIVCYLATKEQKKLPNFPGTVPWNSKKWRMLLHFSNDKNMIFAGRQYPFFSDNALELVSAMIASSFKSWYPSEWHQDKMKKFKKFAGFPSPLVPVGCGMKPLNMLVEKGENSLNYNDILHSSCYDAYYCYNGWYNFFGASWGECGTGRTDDDTKFFIGETALCLQCGSQVVDTESLFCPACAEEHGGYSCDNCGRTIYDDGFNVDGYRICEECYENQTAVCSDCGERYFIDRMCWDPHEFWICHTCLNNRKES